MIISGTGHRPDKLGGYSPQAFNKLASVAMDWIKSDLTDSNPTIISGMALGWDMALATAAYYTNISFIAALPCRGQHSMWPVASQNMYFDLLTKSKYAYLVDRDTQLLSHESSFYRDQLKSDNSYSAIKMQLRNEWMVNKSNLILAMYDGTSGGTHNCIQYAQSKGKQIVNLYNQWQTK